MPISPSEAAGVLRKISKTPISVMEVCGTHTVSVFRSGIRSVLPPTIRLVSGPGCPVCVTGQGEIEAALSLMDRGAVVTAYGDMFRVPCEGGSLSSKRSRGFDARVVTGAMEVLSLAESLPEREIVFLAAGFETTAPATAALILEAAGRGVKNLSVLSFHKRTPPAVELLASDPGLGLSGFLLPGHVSVILGHGPFRFLPEKYRLPGVIAGFEADQILLGLAEIVRQHEAGAPALASVYGRAVKKEGNLKALGLMEKVFETRDTAWRGIGVIPASGLALRREYGAFDAEKKFGLTLRPGTPPPLCRCGEVLMGRITPPECPLFRTACTPGDPVGPCMVSSEGTCGAYFRFHREEGK